MTKLEQNPMSTTKGMQWAPPMNDLSLGPLSYSPYSQNYSTTTPSPARHGSSPGMYLPPPSSAGTSTSSSVAASSPMKMSTERGGDRVDAKPTKKRSSTSTKKAPEVPPGLEHFHSKYPKPTHSYSFLITTAILESPQQQLTLNDIYEWVMDRYPWYRTAINGWKNSIRHNLSLNKAFMRVPRPQNEPGKGSYWKLDPNHQNPLDQPHNGGSGAGGSARTGRNSSRRSSAGQRGASGRGNRRATSDPTPHPLPQGQTPEIPLTPVPVLPKRPGHETDPYLFKIDTPPAPTIIPTLPTSSAANRRHSHLLSHEHNYSSPQEQLQHIEQQQQHQQGPYATQMTSSFALSGLNTQHHHPSGLFSPTSPTGAGPNGEYGHAGSFYSTNGGTPSHSLSNGMMDPDSSSFSRFSNPGLYFPQNGGNASAPITSAGRPLSMPTSSPYGAPATGTGHYGEYSHGNSQHGGSHTYGHISQNGGAGAPFYPSSVGYGLSPPSNRTNVNGGSTGQGYGSQSYRNFHDYGNNNNANPSDYNSGNGHSRSSSLMSLSSPVSSSFMSAASSAPSSSYAVSPSSFGPGPSGMLSPVSPGGHNGAGSALPMSMPSSVPNSMRPPSSSMVVPQESKGQINGGTINNGVISSRTHSGW